MGRDGNVSARTGAASGASIAAQSKRRIADLKQVIGVSSIGSECAPPSEWRQKVGSCCRTLGLDPCASDQFGKLGRRDRHLRYADIEWRQRVLNRGYDRGGGRNDADFANAFYAERIVRRRRFLVERLQFRHVRRRR